MAKSNVGKAIGDEKTRREGQVAQVKDKLQNTLGGTKDALRGKR